MDGSRVIEIIKQGGSLWCEICIKIATVTVTLLMQKYYLRVFPLYIAVVGRGFDN